MLGAMAADWLQEIVGPFDDGTAGQPFSRSQVLLTLCWYHAPGLPAVRPHGESSSSASWAGSKESSHCEGRSRGGSADRMELAYSVSLQCERKIMCRQGMQARLGRAPEEPGRVGCTAQQGRASMLCIMTHSTPSVPSTAHLQRSSQVALDGRRAERDRPTIGSWPLPRPAAATGNSLSGKHVCCLCSRGGASTGVGTAVVPSAWAQQAASRCSLCRGSRGTCKLCIRQRLAPGG